MTAHSTSDVKSSGRETQDMCMTASAVDVDPGGNDDECSDCESSKIVHSTAVRVRGKKRCPVRGCNSYVIALPRHLRQCHGWEKQKSIAAVQRFALRKPYRFAVQKSEKKYVDSHRYKPCPVEGCLSIVKRLPPHIRQHHGIRDAATVRHLLRTAKRFRLKDEEVKEPSSVEDDDDCTFQMPSSVDRNEDGICSSLTSAEVSPLTYSDSAEVERDPEMGNASEVDVSIDEESVNKFSKWLQSADGGLKSMKSAKQHAYQLKVVAKVVDDKSRLSEVLCKQSLEKFLHKYVLEKKFLPGTTKSYLASVVHFYNYLILQGNLSATNKLKVQTMIPCLRRWIASFRKQCSERTLQRMDDDIQHLVTPEDIHKFDNSEPACTAVKILGWAVASEVHSVSLQDFVLVRDYLLAQIALTNANRAGVLSNMTIKQVKEAREVDDHKIISVTKHKTAWTQGPAKVVLTESLYSWLQIYITKMHRLVVGESAIDTSPVFVSTSGEGMESSQITRALKSIWSKAGLGEKITCTLIRKSAVTVVHQEAPGSAGNLADLMCHREATASKCYRMVNREKTSVAAATQLQKLFAKESTMNDENDESADEESAKSRALWTADLLAKLRLLFQEEISSGKISMPCVKKKISQCENYDLTVLSVRQIYDKVRQEISLLPVETQASNRTVVVADVHVDADISSDVSIVCPSTNADSALAKVFSQADVVAILELCKCVIESGPISQDRIKVCMNGSVNGLAILQRYHISQIVNRIKYERKKAMISRLVKRE